jgi:hypothetical protein
MSVKLENELRLRSYLLGDLNSDEQQHIEQNLLTDSAAFDELGCAETDLIDDCLEGMLSDREKERFENFFCVAPERRQQVRFAQALKRYIAEQKNIEKSQSLRKGFRSVGWYPGNPVLTWSLAACLLFLIVGGSLAALHITRLQKALDKATSGNPQQQLLELQKQNGELASALQREQARVSQLQQYASNAKNEAQARTSPLLGQMQSSVLVVALAPGLLRDMGGVQKIRIPDGTNLIQFDLKMEPQDYSRYQITLQRVGEDTFWTQISPKTQSVKEQAFFRLILPAHLLRPGDFVLKLSGSLNDGNLEDVGNYYFRIAGK